MKLTEKQKRFIDYYIETGNATEACKRAGYKGKNLDVMGSQNLVKLKTSIQEKLEKKDNKRIASQDEVLEYLTKVMRGEELDQSGLNASLQDRIKCAELLGKRYGTFKDKVETTNEHVVINIDLSDE